jgi:hypothetical protein
MVFMYLGVFMNDPIKLLDAFNPAKPDRFTEIALYF